MRFIIRLGLVGLLFGVPVAPAAAQNLDEDRIRQLAQSVLAETPGLSLAVGRDGRILVAAGFGAASLEPETPVTPDTRFRVYSVSKPWTAAAALRLAVAGRLDPDAPISVPSYPDKGVAISAFHLGTHSSGIRHYAPGEAETNLRCATVTEAVEIFADDPLLYTPGTDRSYSTWGFVLLGAVIEQAAGEPFDAVLRGEVLDPSGMSSTVHAAVADGPLARAHEPREGGGFREVTDTTDPSCKWGGGGYLSTATDLVRFPLAVLAGELLPPPAVGLLFDGDEPVHRTGGSGPGGTAHVRTDLESGLVVALTANTGGALETLSRLADSIAAAATPAPVVTSSTVMAELAVDLDDAVPQWLEETGEPGLAVALMEDCRMVWTAAWGLADRSTGRSIETGSVFNVGSISKTLTAWGVLRLAETGAIDLDAPVGAYLERWHPKGDGFDPDRVTVRRLLSHTAGINVPSVSGVDPGEPLPALLDDIVRGRPALDIEPVRIAAEPGAAFAYSGGGYMILQLMIEDVTGRAFADWMAGEVLEPLGMQSSGFGLDPRLEALAAIPYAADGESYALRRFPGLAAAGLWSTLDDMTAFLTAHCQAPDGTPAGRGVVSPEGLASMWRAQAPAERYGLGYEVFPPLGDQPVVAHSGSNFGWKANFLLFPGLGTGIVALTNVDEGNTRMMVLEAFRDAVMAAAKSGRSGEE